MNIRILKTPDNLHDGVHLANVGEKLVAQTLALGFRIGEVSCPTKYFTDASSINFRRSVKYGFGCLGTGSKFRLAKMGLIKSKLFLK